MSDEDEQERQPLDLTDTHLSQLRELLLRLAIADPLLEEFTVSFSGGGDEGTLNDFECEPESEAAQAILDESGVYDFINDILCNCGYNWWDNDGGDGLMTVSLKTRTVSVDMNINVQSSESYPMGTTI